ncbi:Crp/Fnr family transcriptional regulator [Rhodocytophaga rosea]|uniref:Crp/Fnr family transcriptional regulator n=1 Tax=Rhodocytophaga rosea TaxID=2704465 RepID=A0A6C0GR47_9BACT|nr:Crp/Fnr family transcriptional regulator [Rhodocytophaga rosea]QHT70344.1 Crp/Fnr family transcriptional regulator [Rhodocytophaga rosea]
MIHELLLSGIEKHVTLSEADKDYIRRIFTLRKYKKGQFLLHEGAVCRNQIFIKTGTVITYLIDLEGHEHIIQLGIEGWWIGDFQSYVFQQPALCHVLAIEDTEVLEAPYEKIQQLYDIIPQFDRFHRILTQHAYVAFQQRVLQNLSMRAEDRYLAFREKYPKLELRLPQKYIASYLGITPEFLSRIKKSLQQSDSKKS